MRLTTPRGLLLVVLAALASTTSGSNHPGVRDDPQLTDDCKCILNCKYTVCLGVTTGDCYDKCHKDSCQDVIPKQCFDAEKAIWESLGKPGVSTTTATSSTTVINTPTPATPPPTSQVTPAPPRNQAQKDAAAMMQSKEASSATSSSATAQVTQQTGAECCKCQDKCNDMQCGASDDSANCQAACRSSGGCASCPTSCPGRPVSGEGDPLLQSPPPSAPSASSQDDDPSAGSSTTPKGGKTKMSPIIKARRNELPPPALERIDAPEPLVKRGGAMVNKNNDDKESQQQKQQQQQRRRRRRRAIPSALIPPEDEADLSSDTSPLPTPQLLTKRAACCECKQQCHRNCPDNDYTCVVHCEKSNSCYDCVAGPCSW